MQVNLVTRDSIYVIRSWVNLVAKKSPGIEVSLPKLVSVLHSLHTSTEKGYLQI